MSKDQADKLNTAQSSDQDPETVEFEQTAGARLRGAREARALDLRDVARETRQSQDTLAALEEMETTHIPASILRLQARNYARFLGLPEEEIASAYAEQRGSTNAQAMPVEVAQRSFPTKIVAVSAAGVLVAALAITGVSLLLRPSAPQEVDQLAISARLAPAGVEQFELGNLSVSGDNELSLLAKRDAWIEVRGSDGTVFRSRQMSAGESYYPRLGAGWTITVRDAGAFDWRLGGDTYAAVGNDQQALYSLSVDGVHETAVAAQSAALAEASGGPAQRR